MRRPPASIEVLIPILLTATALGLRLVTLNTQPLSADEAMHLQSLSLMETLGLDLHLNPPLFRLLVRGVSALAPTPLAARMVPLVAGVATVPVLFVLVRRRVGILAATFAGLLLTIHPWHIRHSQTLRAYSLLTLLYLFTVVLTWPGVKPDATPPWRAPLRHSLLCMLLVSTHYLGFVLLAGEVVALFWQKRWRHGATVLLTMSVMAALWGSAIAAGTSAKLAGSPDYVAGLDFVLELATALTCPGGLAFLAAWLLAAYGARRLAPRTIPALLASVTLPVVALGFVMPIELRYALPGLPLLHVLIGVGGQVLWHNRTSAVWRGLLVLLFLLVTVGTGYLLPVYYAAPENPKAAALAHRDLVHEATVTADLVADIARPDFPLVVIGRGQLSHQLLLLGHNNRYPRVVHSVLLDGTDQYVAPNFTLHFIPAPDPARPQCPTLPEPPFALLLEAPYPCDLPASCTPVSSRERFSTSLCRRGRPGAAQDGAP